MQVLKEERASDLSRRFRQRSASVAIVGLGYVGLPLVRVFHDAGYHVIGYDIDTAKIERLKRGEAYLKHLGTDLAAKLAASERFTATSGDHKLADADVVVLCVPTPLGEHREPDLRFVVESAKMVAARLRPGQLVILTSTSYPGTTREVVLPLLEAGGLACGKDFFLAYSPEREDPGRADATTEGTPKLVGGIDEASGDLAFELLSQAIVHVHRVESAEIAEAAKLLENIYRAVNIALVNELKVLLGEMDIDVWKVIEAASTKPFGFQTFYPGPGLGGHCIPVDPYYLTWKAKEVGLNTRFIELAGEVNANMPAYVVSRIVAALNDRSLALRGARVLVIGIAYKPNVDDARETPAAEILERLIAGGAQVTYHDPHIPIFPAMRKHTLDLTSQPLDEELLGAQDCVVVVTDHDEIDWALVGAHAPLILDTRNVMATVRGVRAQVVKA